MICRYGNHLGSVDFAMDWSLPAALVALQHTDGSTGVLFALPTACMVFAGKTATGRRRGFSWID
jgi:hypothetical protein